MSLQEDAKKAAYTVAARHWRVWEWLNGKLSRAVSSRPTFRPSSLQELWSGIAKSRYSDGDFIEIRPSSNGEVYWYVQEWLPRSPGQLWVDDNLFNISIDDLAHSLDLRTSPRDLVYRFYSRYSHWEGQFTSPEANGRSLLQQGLAYRSGIYHPPLSSDEDRYAVVGLVTNKEYFIDLAFPIVVSQQAYRKIIEARSEQNAVEFEGVFQLREQQVSNPFDAYLAAVGAEADDTLRSLIHRVVGIRNFLGRVESPLDISTRTHSSHPTGTIRVEGHNGDPLSTRRGVIFLCRSLVDTPIVLPETLSERDFLLGEDHQFGTVLHPITDFDARQARFRSDAPVAVNPTTDRSVIALIHDSVASDKGVGVDNAQSNRGIEPTR